MSHLWKAFFVQHWLSMSLEDPILFLDGGLATELERAFGKDLSGIAHTHIERKS